MRQNTPEQFNRQLREGHFNELRVALYFMLKGAHVRIGYTGQRYDLHVIPAGGKPGFSVEVKWDKRAQETGNLYFEIRNTRRDEPSGVAATTADYWCHVIGDGDRALLVGVRRLREILRTGGFRMVTTRAEDSNSQGLLVPHRRLENEKGVVQIELPTVEGFFGTLFR